MLKDTPTSAPRPKIQPEIIQGGMGIAVSGWRLAQTVASLGQLGVVSGTAINSVLVRRLQDGDLDGNVRKALRAFPQQDVSQEILQTYFIEGGRAKNAAYKRAPMFTLNSPQFLLRLTVASAFVEVWLAKQGHTGKIGINLLEKIQLPNLACIYGALLADVDYVIMGAGIPREIPGAIDLLSVHKAAKIKIPVEGSKEEFTTSFDPEIVLDGTSLQTLHRPQFIPIVSSAVLAASLQKKSTGEVNGFVVEGPLAGGHNAPPRGPLKLSDAGEPIYGPRDIVELQDMADLGLPFWMAGHYATPEKLRVAKSLGAQGIQVGTLFAFCNESGLDAKLKTTTIQRVITEPMPEGGWIFTDPRSSPTGFPFKAVKLCDSASAYAVYDARKRICDLGYLRHAYAKPDGTTGLRCPAEPVEDYVKKGGLVEDTVGRKCLCNALMSDIGMAQIQFGDQVEPHLLTAGDDLNGLARVLKPGHKDYSAADVLNYILQKETERPATLPLAT